MKRKLASLFCLVLLIASLVMLCGCTKSREETQRDTEKVDDIHISGLVPVTGPDGTIINAPISFDIKRTGTEAERSESKRETTIDGAAIGREIGSAVRMAMQGAGGGLPGWVNVVGDAAMAAGVGYLALKKREQLKGGKS